MVCDRYIIKVEVVLLMDDNKINNSKNTFFFHDFKMVCDKYIIKVILVMDDNKSKIVLITTCHLIVIKNVVFLTNNIILNMFSSEVSIKQSHARLRCAKT